MASIACRATDSLQAQRALRRAAYAPVALVELQLGDQVVALARLVVGHKRRRRVRRQGGRRKDERAVVLGEAGDLRKRGRLAWSGTCELSCSRWWGRSAAPPLKKPSLTCSTLDQPVVGSSVPSSIRSTHRPPSLDASAQSDADGDHVSGQSSARASTRRRKR